MRNRLQTGSRFLCDVDFPGVTHSLLCLAIYRHIPPPPPAPYTRCAPNTSQTTSRSWESMGLLLPWFPPLRLHLGEITSMAYAHLWRFSPTARASDYRGRGLSTEPGLCRSLASVLFAAVNTVKKRRAMIEAFKGPRETKLLDKKSIYYV